MKMSDYTPDQIPAIFGEGAGRPAETVTNKEDLMKEGGNFDGNSAMKGDVWEFPDFDDMLIKKQATRAGGTNMAFLVLAERTRNKKKQLAWFNLNTLSRQDANREPIMQDWYDLGNVYARAKHIAGRKVSIANEKTVDMPKFDNGVRVVGETEARLIAIVPFN